MRRIWILFAAFLLCGIFSYAQDQKQPAKAPEFKIPEEDAKKENPVKPTPAGLEAAKKLYGTDCAICHGVHGDGKGEIAGDLKTKPKDLRDPASLEKMTDGEIFYILNKGKGEMPGEGDRTKPEQLWNLVNYVRSLAKKDSGAKPPEKSQ